MQIKKLTIHSFGSIDSQSIDFENDALVSLEAINHDTGGASGAGKSMLFRALEYVFCVLDSPAKNYQNRITEKKPHVIVEFDIGTDSYIVERRLKTSNELKITKNGQVLSEGGKEAEAYLFDRIIKIPKHFFAKLLHKKQGEHNFFVALTPKQSFQLLTEILGLHYWEELVDNLNENVKKNQILIDSLGPAIEAAENKIVLDTKEIEAKQDELLGLEQTKKELEQGLALEKTNLENLKNEAQQIDAAIKKETASSIPKEESEKLKAVKIEIEGIEAAIAALKAEKDKALLEIKKEEQGIVEKERELERAIVGLKNKLVLSENTAKNKEQELLKEKKELENKIAHLKTDKCPVCLREWAGDDAERTLLAWEERVKKIELEIQDSRSETQKLKEQIEKDILSNQKNLESLSFNREALKTKKENAAGIEAQIEQKTSLLLAKKDEMMAIKQKMTELLKAKVADMADKLAKISKEIDNKNTQIVLLERQFSEANTRISLTKQTIEKLKLSLETAKKEVEDKKRQKKDEENNLIAIKATAQYVKAYSSHLFSSFLDSVFSEANSILSSIPNAAHVVTSYELTRDLKNGKTKEGELKVIYNSGAYSDVDFDTFSGGEQTSIGLALDIAFVKALASSLPPDAIPNLWFLDEPFDGLDPISKMAFLDIFRLSGRSCLVVDHDKTVKDMVERVLLVEKRNGITELSKK